MNLLIVRHGKAGNDHDKAEWKARGKSDDSRPLTEKGFKEIKVVAKRLADIVPDFKRIAASPLVRAQQTAEPFQEAFKIKKIETIRELDHRSSREDLLDWLSVQSPTESLILVGHEPSLSIFISWLITGQDSVVVEMKKGAAAHLSTDKPIRPGNFTLNWLLPPKILLSF